MRKMLLMTALMLAGCDKGLQTAAPEPADQPEAPAMATYDSGTAAPLQYVGTWGQDLAQCQIPQEQQNAPMIISATGYDQHEAHCTFGKAEETAPGSWKIEESCSVEGDPQTDVLEFNVSADTLILWPGKNTTKLIRCPAS